MMATSEPRFVIDRRPLWVILLGRLKRQIWLGVLLALFALAVSIAPPEGLPVAGWRTVCIFALCAILWASSLLPVAITSLLAIALLPLLDVMPAVDAYGAFGSKVVFFILGAFMLSAAVITSGLSNRIATRVVIRFGATPRKLVMTIFGLTAAGATVMSSHAVGAMVFPIVLDIARALELKPLKSRLGRALFFAMAWGCIIGGSLTILGGGRAPLAIGLLEEATSQQGATGSTIGFLDFMAYSVPLVGMMLLFGAWLLTRRFDTSVTSTEQAQETLSAQLHAMGKISVRERLVGLMVIVTVALWAFMGDTLGLANIAICAMAGLFLFGTMTWREVEENINWGVIVMYGGAICLGGAMESSGAAKWLTGQVLELTDSAALLLLTIAVLSAALTEFMSNSAVVAMLMPPALALAAQHGISLEAMTMTVVLPSNFAFMFPVSTPVTAIAWSAGYYTPRQVAKSGLVLHAVGLVAMALLILWYWPAMGLL